MINVYPEHLILVRDILGKHATGMRVIVFGSRVTGTAKPHSDLDLAIDAGTPLGLSRLGDIQDAFSESDLPFRVDVVDLCKISEAFKKIILEQFEVIQD